MAQIKRIRMLKGVGILADRAAKEPGPNFLRYNLIYGFNGSGKSTLSRAFSCLQTSTVHQGLPEGCAFEFELTDGTVLTSPEQLTGLQGRLCVFNTDFIERNLRWSEGKANSIFYISEEQAEAAAALRAADVELPLMVAALTAAEQSLQDRSHTLATFKRGLAKSVFAKLHLANRKYEAPQLQTDYENMTYDAAAILTPGALDEHESVAGRSSPPPRVSKIEAPITTIASVIQRAVENASANLGETMVADLAAHPEMVPWARAGHDYHVRHDLKSCLFCGQDLTAERKTVLAAAFNDALSRFISELTDAEGKARGTLNLLQLALLSANELVLMPELKVTLRTAIDAFAKAMSELRDLFALIDTLYSARKAAPTIPVEFTPPDSAQTAEIVQSLLVALDAINAAVLQHNEMVADFGTHQQAARDSIKRHFLAEGDAEYQAAKMGISDAQTARDQASDALAELQGQIGALRTKVRTHGPAADIITKLIRLYLGHGELTVVAAKEGYELHRHGRLVKGPPSEGEKTSLALCYFLSTLGSDGRKVKDLIVLIDDPISSLDTKAMNYACALVLSRLREADQIFVLTHNQHCMNEFKKSWKTLAYPKKEETTPTATLLYLDVRVPCDGGARSATLLEMSKLLREYDSEYHFLCTKVLEFEKAGATYSEYGYLMPNIIRRVLELFLAFKVPGTSTLQDKLDAIAKIHSGLDKTRMVALERLSQVESHSDTMEDFVSHSSMTIEETRDANAALLELMGVADENHTKAIRKQCKA